MLIIKQIPDLKGYYATSEGEIWSTHRSKCNGNVKILRPGMHSAGYRIVSLKCNGTQKSFYVHRLIASTFLGDKNEQVNHKNLNKTDNNLINLEWVSQVENIKHAQVNGVTVKGENVGTAKLKNQDVVIIKQLLDAGETGKNISGKFNVSAGTISMIKTGKIWTHI